jgi:DNA-binding response OmpR family regulator
VGGVREGVPHAVEGLRWQNDMNELILVVDDEPKIAKLAQDYLENSGYRVATAPDGPSALDATRREKPDLVVLDLNLPGMDGLDVCRELRRESDVPIIMLTARIEETDRLIGLELGADDYITKPFSPRELVARVRAVLRRIGGGTHQPGIIRAGELTIDLAGHRVKAGETEVPLTPIEFNILAAMAQHPGQVFNRTQLIDRLHGVAYEGFDRSIDSHIKNLRRKIELDPAEPTHVLTVFGVGYKFNDET